MMNDSCGKDVAIARVFTNFGDAPYDTVTQNCAAHAGRLSPSAPTAENVAHADQP